MNIHVIQKQGKTNIQWKACWKRFCTFQTFTKNRLDRQDFSSIQFSK